MGLCAPGTARRPMSLEARKHGESRREGGERESNQERGNGDSEQAGSNIRGESL